MPREQQEDFESGTTIPVGQEEVVEAEEYSTEVNTAPRNYSSLVEQTSNESVNSSGDDGSSGETQSAASSRKRNSSSKGRASTGGHESPDDEVGVDEDDNSSEGVGEGACLRKGAELVGAPRLTV